MLTRDPVGALLIDSSRTCILRCIASVFIRFAAVASPIDAVCTLIPLAPRVRRLIIAALGYASVHPATTHAIILTATLHRQVS